MTPTQARQSPIAESIDPRTGANGTVAHAMPARAKAHVVHLHEVNPYPQDVRLRMEAESLAAAGYRVEVVAPRASGQSRRERINGVEVRRFRLFEGSGHGAIGFLAEYLVAGVALHIAAVRSILRGASIVHVHNPPDTLFLVAALARLTGRKVIFDHHDLAPETIEVKIGPGVFSRVALLFERLTFAFTDRVIATNESYAEVAVRRGRKRRAEVTIVRNAPDVSWLKFPLQIAEGQLRSPHIAYAGVMSSQDGVEALAPILADLCARNPHLRPRLTVVGDGDRRPQLEADLARLGLASQVNLTGFVSAERVPEILQDADICVEPAPPIPVNRLSTMTKVGEYLALGKPVVAYDMLETRRTVGDAAFLVPPGDMAAFADGIAALADDSQLRTRLAHAARRRAAEIAWDHSERNLLELYAELSPSLEHI